jgi:uncharacterized membrane protein (DUF2068 family)
MSADKAEILAHWAKVVRVDPEDVLVHSLISGLTGLSHQRLRELSVGTFFYGGLFATEGVGLILRKRWAEYFTTVTTTAFLPLEIYELIHKPTTLRLAVLAANVGIVVYLIATLIRSRRGRS